MKTTIGVAIATSLIVLVPSVQAEMATMDEALVVAENWIRLIIDTEGRWGTSDTAYIETVDEFVAGNQVVGYHCRVHPRGFIVLSLHTELAPVKAYSAICNLNSEAADGMADLLKAEMKGILDSLEEQHGGFGLSAQSQGVLAPGYLPAWRALGGRPAPSNAITTCAAREMQFKGGIRPLLSSRWTQGDPYNARCPAPLPSDFPLFGDDCDQEYCSVGCGPLAGAQVMRYWAWPPGHLWSLMPNTINKEIRVGAPRPPGYYDEEDLPVTEAQIDAVAELCLDVGVAGGAAYCDGPECATGMAFTSELGDSLLDAFEDDFRYNDAAENYYRLLPDPQAGSQPAYDAVEWFNLIKDQLNKNRPVPYSLKNHTIVCDGWREFSIGGTYIRQYHMNYGWAANVPNRNERCDDWDKYGNSNAWYTLDEVPCSELGWEQMILSLYPGPSIGRWLDDYTTYPKKTFNYRYFDQDASGPEAIFEPGQNLQFLAGVGVTRRGDAPGGPIQFLGAASDPTRMYSIKGTASGGLEAVIRIGAGAIRLYRNGRMGFHPRGPEERPVDLYALGEPFRDFSPQILSAGVEGQDLTIWGILENGGSDASGRFLVRFYASVDNILGEGDHWLGEAEIPSIAPGKVFSFRVTRDFSTDVPRGTYYVGWIVDPDNEIGEANELNNTAYKESYQLAVE